MHNRAPYPYETEAFYSSEKIWWNRNNEFKPNYEEFNNLKWNKIKNFSFSYVDELTLKANVPTFGVEDCLFKVNWLNEVRYYFVRETLSINKDTKVCYLELDIYCTYVLKMNKGLLTNRTLIRTNIGRNEEQDELNLGSGFFNYRIDCPRTTKHDRWYEITDEQDSYKSTFALLADDVDTLSGKIARYILIPIGIKGNMFDGGNRRAFDNQSMQKYLVTFPKLLGYFQLKPYYYIQHQPTHLRIQGFNTDIMCWLFGEQGVSFEDFSISRIYDQDNNQVLWHHWMNGKINNQDSRWLIFNNALFNGTEFIWQDNVTNAYFSDKEERLFDLTSDFQKYLVSQKPLIQAQLANNFINLFTSVAHSMTNFSMKSKKGRFQGGHDLISGASQFINSMIDLKAQISHVQLNSKATLNGSESAQQKYQMSVFGEYVYTNYDIRLAVSINNFYGWKGNQELVEINQAAKAYIVCDEQWIKTNYASFLSKITPIHGNAIILLLSQGIRVGKKEEIDNDFK